MAGNEDTRHRRFRPLYWILHAFLFVVSAGGTMFVFGVVYLFSSFFLWVIAPAPLIYGGVLLIALLLFSGLYLLGRRRRWGWLKAIGLGGASVPVFLAALILVGPLILPEPDPAQTQKPNQREPLTSPSGKYVLTVPIERSKAQKGPLGYGFPYWHVTISDPNGTVLYRDPEDKFGGIHNIYWTWGPGDIAWVYESDAGGVYFYRVTDGQWTRGWWGHGKTGHVELDIAPPALLYPTYVSAGPVQNLGTPWRLSGFSRTTAPNVVTMVSFTNTQTGQEMMLREGDSQNGVTVLDIDWEQQEAVVEIKGRRLTLNIGPHR